MSRVWQNPNSKTFTIPKIRDFIIRNLPTGDIVVLDCFANECSIKDYVKGKVITNDINPYFETDFNLSAEVFLRTFEKESVDVVLYDPPYSPTQVKRCYEGFGLKATQSDTRRDFIFQSKREIAAVLKPAGLCFSFGWNSIGIGKNQGFEIKEIMLVCHGGNRNDTICVLEEKIQGWLI